MLKLETESFIIKWYPHLIFKISYYLMENLIKNLSNLKAKQSNISMMVVYGVSHTHLNMY